MENLYEGMPTYYVKLVKQHSEEIRHLKARWNQMYTQRHNAINAGKADRAEEINAQMLENFNRQRALQDKIDRYTKCQCSACKV
jgi:hypothetical protein